MMRGCLRWTDKMAERNKIERSLITFISFFFFFPFRTSVQVSKKSSRFKEKLLVKRRGWIGFGDWDGRGKWRKLLQLPTKRWIEL